MAGSHRLSQRISEGDGIAVIARVEDAGAARAAEAAGAKALALAGAVDGLRDATSLPVLWLGRGAPSDADAVAVRVADEPNGDFETVVVVADEEELEEALEALDPPIFLIAPKQDDDEVDPLECVLELLPDVPAGKLAIAELDGASRDDVLALERAGFDAVLVDAGATGDVVGERAPDF